MNIKLLPKKNKENNRDYVYRVLSENIIQLILRPGDLISEPELCKVFALSRTPIREALIKLTDETLVNIYPQKGSFVAKINMAYVKEALFLRRNLESGILKEAIETGFSKVNIDELKKIIGFHKTLAEIDANPIETLKLDNSFHQTIFNFCGKQRLWNSVVSLSGHYTRLRFLETIEKLNIEKVITQHEEIVRILEEKDLQAIDKIIVEHTSNINSYMDDLMIRYPNYFIDTSKINI